MGYSPHIHRARVGGYFSRKKYTLAPVNGIGIGIMKQNSIRLTQQYVTTLGQHLKNGPQADLSPAVGLGRRAVVLGLETLDLARIHEQALVRLNLNQPSKALTKRAGIFFAEANTAIEANHWDARQS